MTVIFFFIFCQVPMIFYYRFNVTNLHKFLSCETLTYLIRFDVLVKLEILFNRLP